VIESYKFEFNNLIAIDDLNYMSSDDSNFKIINFRNPEKRQMIYVGLSPQQYGGDPIETLTKPYLYTIPEHKEEISQTGDQQVKIEVGPERPQERDAQTMDGNNKENSELAQKELLQRDLTVSDV